MQATETTTVQSDTMQDANTTNCACRKCGKDTPPQIHESTTGLDWVACDSCASWFHVKCLKPEAELQAFAVDWCCSDCDAKATEDVVGLGDFAQHTASKYNSNLQMLCTKDLHRAIPVFKDATKWRATGLLPNMLDKLFGECDAEQRSLALSKLSIMGVLGASGQGKTTTLNCLLQSCADQHYLPEAPSLARDKVVQSLLQQLWPEYLSNNNTMQWNPQQNHPIFGSATFDPEGLLIGQEELLAADDEATKGLVQDLISGQQPQSNKQHRALLPVFQQGCKLQVTSCQNIVVLKSSRTGMLLLPYGAKMLLEVVNACKQQQQLRAGYLDRDAAKSIQVLFPDVHTRCPADNHDDEHCFKNLPETTRRLNHHLDPNLRKLLGTAIEVVLPNKNRQHDMLFVQQLLRQMAGVERGTSATMPAWMHMIWQVYVLVDDGPLPPNKGIMDLPGDDDNPIHGVVRCKGLQQVNSVMMMLSKTFGAAGEASLLRMLQSGAGEQARLMQRILQEEVSMVVVMNEKGWTSYEDLDDHQQALAEDYVEYTSDNRAYLAAELKSKVQRPEDVQRLQQVADRTPIVMFRPLMAAAILQAVDQGALQVNDVLKRRLEATGHVSIYKALTSSSRSQVLPYIKCCGERMKCIQELAAFVRDAAAERTQEEDEQAFEHLETLKDKGLKGYCSVSLDRFCQASSLQQHLAKHSSTQEEPDLVCYHNIRGVWLTEGKHKVEQQLQRATFTFRCYGRELQLPLTLETVKQCQEFGQQLQQLAEELKNGTCQLLQPLLDWVDKVSLDCLNPITDPVASLPISWLEHALQVLEDSNSSIPADSQVGTAIQMYRQHVLPALCSKPTLGPDRGGHNVRTTLLQNVKAELQSSMQRHLQLLLKQQQQHVLALEKSAAQVAALCQAPIHADGASSSAAVAPPAGTVRGSRTRGVSPIAAAAVSSGSPQQNRPNLKQILASLIEDSFPDGSSLMHQQFVQESRAMLAAQVFKAIPPVIKTPAEFINRLRADMLLLGNPTLANRFADATSWLHNSDESTIESLQQHAERGARQAADLVLLGHQYRSVMMKYSIHSASSIMVFDTTPRPQLWSDFKVIASRDAEDLYMGTSEWRNQLPAYAQLQEGRRVDVPQCCAEFASYVLGVQGTVHGQAGSRPLLLRNSADQLTALEDLLTIHLLKLTQRELLHGKDHQMQYLTGITACQALISGALQTDPWVLLTLMSLITGSVLHVLVPGDSTAGSSSATGTGSGWVQQSSSTRRGSKRHAPRAVIVKIDVEKVPAAGIAASTLLVPSGGSAPSPLAQATAAADGETSSSSQASASKKHRRVVSLVLQLEASNRWQAQVLSSRLIKPGSHKPGSCAMIIGSELSPKQVGAATSAAPKNYVVCVMCSQKTDPSALLRCCGCHVTVHSSHIPQEQRPAAVGGVSGSWWCAVCTRRGLQQQQMTAAAAMPLGEVDM